MKTCMYRLIVAIFWLCTLVIAGFAVGAWIAWSVPLEDKLPLAVIAIVGIYAAAAGLRGVK